MPQNLPKKLLVAAPAIENSRMPVNHKQYLAVFIYITVFFTAANVLLGASKFEAKLADFGKAAAIDRVCAIVSIIESFTVPPEKRRNVRYSETLLSLLLFPLGVRFRGFFTAVKLIEYTP
jgi:hypothetical protein